jgi:hypothetical protein
LAVDAVVFVRDNVQPRIDKEKLELALSMGVKASGLIRVFARNTDGGRDEVFKKVLHISIMGSEDYQKSTPPAPFAIKIVGPYFWLDCSWHHSTFPVTLMPSS